MSATAFQRQRRALQEQTSVSARMNEAGPGDPYAKTIKNYDESLGQDTGAKHQAGDPPPYSLTPHTPEAESAEGKDGPAASPSRRANEKVRVGVEGDEYSDQREYAALDKRAGPSTSASEANVYFPEQSASATSGASELADKEGVDLAQVEGSGADGRITKADVERHLEADEAEE